MKYLVLALSLGLAACASTPSDHMSLPPPSGLASTAPASPTPRNPVSEPPAARKGYDFEVLQNKLGMNRANGELGFDEKPFDGCRLGMTGDDGRCGPRYFTAVNFRLLCRDSEGTVSEVVTNVTPVVTDQVLWKLFAPGGAIAVNGVTHTNGEGYGSVQFVTDHPARGRRLTLTVGRNFLGLEISQVSQIVVPIYWCTQIAGPKADHDQFAGDAP